MTDTGCILLNVEPAVALKCAAFDWQRDCPTFTCTPSGGGQLYEIRPGADSQSDWDAAIAAMNSTGGNVIRFLPGTHSGIYRARGSAHDPGPAESGVPGNHNCVEGTGAVLTGTDPNPGLNATLDMAGVKHWDVHNITITGGKFGLRFMSSGGTAGSPVQVSNVDVSGTDDARLVLSAWFSDQTVPTEFVDIWCPTLHGPNSANNPNPWYSEGLYIGTGFPENVDTSGNITVRGLHAYGLTSDAIDIKSNANAIVIEDFYIHDIDLNHFGPNGDTPTGAVSIWASNDGQSATDPATQVTLRDGVIHSISGVSTTFHHPIAVGSAGGTVIDHVTIFDYTTDSAIRVRPFVEVTGDLDISCSTAEKQMLDIFDPDNTGIIVTDTCNLEASDGVTYVGPTTGTADAGYGPGSGFTPLDAPTCSVCGLDTAGCPSTVAGAWAEPQAGWTS